MQQYGHVIVLGSICVSVTENLCCYHRLVLSGLPSVAGDAPPPHHLKWERYNYYSEQA